MQIEFCLLPYYNTTLILHYIPRVLHIIRPMCNNYNTYIYIIMVAHHSTSGGNYIDNTMNEEIWLVIRTRFFFSIKDSFCASSFYCVEHFIRKRTFHRTISEILPGIVKVKKMQSDFWAYCQHFIKSYTRVLATCA